MAMREKLNCPNCGAPITAVTCAYCGTRFYDFADIELFKECYIRIKYQGKIITTKFTPYELTIDYNYHNADLGRNLLSGRLIRTGSTLINGDFELKGRILPNDKGVLYSMEE